MLCPEESLRDLMSRWLPRRAGKVRTGNAVTRPCETPVCRLRQSRTRLRCSIVMSRRRPPFVHAVTIRGDGHRTGKQQPGKLTFQNDAGRRRPRQHVTGGRRFQSESGRQRRPGVPVGCPAGRVPLWRSGPGNRHQAGGTGAETLPAGRSIWSHNFPLPLDPFWGRDYGQPRG